MERLADPRAELRRACVPASLAPYVASASEVRTRAGERFIALPSTWFRLSASVFDDGASPGVALWLSGLHATTGAFVDRSGRESVALLTLRGAMALFDRPLGAVAQRRVPIADLIGEDAAARLATRILEGASPVDALVAWIAERVAVARVFAPSEVRVVALAEALTGASPSRAATVGDLARRLVGSRRQLERDFAAWTGVSPAAFRRVVRFQQAAREIVAGGSLASAALRAGYADQSHMTNALRTFARLTPSALARRTGRVKDALEALADGRMLFLSVDALESAEMEITTLPPACPFTRLAQARRAR